MTRAVNQKKVKTLFFTRLNPIIFLYNSRIMHLFRQFITPLLCICLLAAGRMVQGQQPAFTSFDGFKSALMQAVQQRTSLNVQHKTIPAVYIEQLLQHPPATPEFSRLGLFMSNAIITGRLNLLNLISSAIINISYSTFEDTVNLNNAALHSFVELNNDTFYKAVNAEYLSVDQSLDLTGSVFKSTADFSRMKAGEDVYCNSTQFNTWVEFSNAVIGKSLFFKYAWLNNSAEAAYLRYMDIGKDLDFTGSYFYDSVFLGGSVIARNLLLDRVKCWRQFDAVEITVGGQLTGYYVYLYDLILNSSTVKNLLRFDNSRIDYMDLAFLRQERSSLWLSADTIVSGLLTNMDVSDLHLESSRFTSYLDLSFTNANRLQLSLSTLPKTVPFHPKDTGRLYLDGLTYKTLLMSKMTSFDSLQQFLQVLNAAPVSQTGYYNFEQYCRNVNADDLPDKVYITYRKRTASGIKDWLLDWLVGYGREPARIFIYIIIFILIGTLVFRDKNKMVNVKPEIPETTYNPFFYSFDLFLPVINLKDAENWIPQKQYKFLRFYRRIHALIGWVVIPIGLAAISGLVK